MEKKRISSPLVTINCACGAEVVVDHRSRDGVYVCRSCKAPLRLTPPAKKVPSNGDPPSRGKPRKVTPGIQEIVCRCGERLQVRPEHLGKRGQCPRCGTQMNLEKARDPQTLEMKVRASEAPPPRKPAAAGPPKRERAGPPPAPAGGKAESAALSKIPTGSHSLACRCGARLLVLPEHVGKEAQCPQCGLVMRLFSYHDPETRAVTVTAEPAGGESREPAAGASIASQELLCQCGEHLLVQPEHLDKQVQCAACGTIMKLEKALDPLTSTPTIQARVVGKVDLDSWSLDDFQ